LGEGETMNPFGVAVVADLCEALADLIADAPAVAMSTARKLGSTLRRRVEVAEGQGERELKIRELRATKGLEGF